MKERRVSWSMLSLLASLTGAALIGVLTWVPPLIGRDSGVEPITPGLLTVEDGVGGVVTLGEGRAVSLGPSGMQITNGTDILYRTVRSGSPVSALRGEVDVDGRREDVTRTFSDLTFTSVSITPGSARYLGVLEDGADRVRVELTVTFDGRWVRVDVQAPGADALVLHGAEELGATGYEPVLPDRFLGGRAWWIPEGIGRATPALTTDRRTDQAIGPKGVLRAVDLRRRGHTDIHVWGSRLDVSVSSRARPPQPEETGS